MNAQKDTSAVAPALSNPLDPEKRIILDAAPARCDAPAVVTWPRRVRPASAGRCARVGSAPGVRHDTWQ